MVIVKTLTFTILVPGSVTVLVPYLLISQGTHVHLGGFRFLGILPVVLGTAFYVWCAWDFAVVGKGTPAPIDAPKTFVALGLYRIVRNPMYVGVILIIMGEALLFQSFTLVVYAGLLCLLFHLFVVYFEEPQLKKKFGEKYKDYCKTVPRWIPISIFFRRP